MWALGPMTQYTLVARHSRNVHNFEKSFKSSGEV